MLVFLTTDCAIAPGAAAKGAVGRRADDSFNMITRRRRHLHQRHGLHPGQRHGRQPAHRPPRARITTRSAEALNAVVTRSLCRAIAKRRRGRDQAARMPRCAARADAGRRAHTSPRAVVCSSLVKAAMFGADANWGRVLCAVGYAGAEMDVEQGGRLLLAPPPGAVRVCEDGAGVDFSEEEAKKPFSAPTKSTSSSPCSDGDGRGDGLGLRPDLRLRQASTAITEPERKGAIVK